MKAHGWILPTLAEFFPKNPNLLGTFLPSLPCPLAGTDERWEWIVQVSTLIEGKKFVFV